MSASRNYHINFFKPASSFMRANIKLISAIMVIWALAVFGFHGLMKALETSTPEPAYIAYQEAWPGILDNSATPEQKQALAKTCLTLTGKYIDLRDNGAISKLFSQLVLELLPAQEHQAFLDTVASAKSDKLVDVSAIAAALGLMEAPLLTRMIPYTLTDPLAAKLTTDNLTQVSRIMDRYLVHYQSVITDTQVLGFPFHYLYTAVLLMIIFCLLCLAYCAKIDKVMVQFGLESNDAGGR